MPHWLLIGIIAVALFILRVAYDAWIYKKFYIEGRTLDQQEQAEHLRARGIIFLALAMVVGLAINAFPRLPALRYLEGALLAAALYFIFRASQRVSGLRTITAVILVLAGGAVIVGGIALDIIPRAVNNHATFTIASAALILVAIGMFIVAARLSRPE